MAEGGTQLCGCKGKRTCLICKPVVPEADERQDVLYQCHRCGRIAPDGEAQVDPATPPLTTCAEPCSDINRRLEACFVRGSCCENGPIRFEGVCIIKDFVSAEEEMEIVANIDSWKWAESQSGRRKQDYGPKVNFKRQKVKLGAFNGLPPFSKPLVARIRNDVAADFNPVELCNLEYIPERGSSIDPHLDDSWLWGERLVTLNLLTATILTFTSSHTTTEVRVPLPRRSLVVVKDHARYHWLHAIRRRHILSRRLAITLRELSSEFLPGGTEEETGHKILQMASKFDGEPTNFRSAVT